MKKMKKTLMSKTHGFSAAAVMAAGLLALHTAVSVSAGTVSAETAPLQIVTTIFPEYDWVREVLGENPSGAELTMLLDNGVDLHSFQPAAQDIMKISTCDLFIYVGGESDEWVEDALQESTNPDQIVINLLEELGESAKEEELAEGMQGEEEGEGEEEETEYDEHIWLSLRNACTLTDVMEGALEAIDPGQASYYQEKAAAYKEKLQDLDARYEKAVEEASVKTLLSGCQGRRGLKPFYSREDRALAEQNMERMGITELAGRCYRELSGGQQQRVLLARALCAAGRILLLDEPVAGLDPFVTQDMYERIRDLNREGVTILMISHDMQAALRSASHILHMGNPVFFGTAEAYRSSQAGRLFLEQKGGERI